MAVAGRRCGGRVVYFQHVSDVAHMQHDAVDSLWDPASTSTNNDQQQVVLRLKISIYDLREQERNPRRGLENNQLFMLLLGRVCVFVWVGAPPPPGPRVGSSVFHRFITEMS